MPTLIYSKHLQYKFTTTAIMFFPKLEGKYSKKSGKFLGFVEITLILLRFSENKSRN